MRIHLAALIVSFLLPVCHADDPAEQPVRGWLDNTGTYAVNAQLMAVDAATQQVRLRLESGAEVRLPVRRLSVRDREYVSAFATSQKPGGTVNIRGINWFLDLPDAKQAAAATPALRDDRPIMCFRVLGELSGFM